MAASRSVPLLAVVLACLGASTCSPSADAWRQLWQRSPADFEGQASRKLASTLDRLSAQSQRWQLPFFRRSAGSLTGTRTQRGAALYLLLQIWRQRDDPASLLATCDTLAALLGDDECVDELEAFLPQLAHLATHLPANWLLTSVLERFILHVCESNVHWALQLTWITYGELEENRPGESRSDDEIHARCAALLQRIEQAVVYGAKMVNRDTLRSAAFAHNVNLWLDNFKSSMARSTKATGQADSRPRCPPSPAQSLAAASRQEEGQLRPTGASFRSHAEEEAVIEGWLLKRKARDSWGVWRCCGESWTRRWFSLRECILYYYRGPDDRSARGAIPLSLCHVELRESPRVGEYIKLSARFSRLTLRVRGETPEQTASWLRILRAAAGLPPLSPVVPGTGSVMQCSDLLSTSLAEIHHAPEAAARDSRRSSSLAETVEHGPSSSDRSRSRSPQTLLAFSRMATGTTQLSTSQRCSWMYLTAQRDFVRSLAALSEELYTPRSGVPVIERRPETAAARQKLRTLVAGMFIPPLAYVPLCSSSEKFRRVVRIPPREVGVFVTRERASALLLVEVLADKHTRKLAHLFKGVRTDKKSAAVFDDLRLLPHRPLSWLELLMRRSDAEEDEPLPPPLSDDESSPQSRAQPQPARSKMAAAVREVSVGAARSLDSLYGELWEDKVARIRRASPHGDHSGWALVPIISKANDDVRQEVFVMQLLRFFSRVFPPPLWLQPYHILSTGTRSGLLEFLPNTQSLHALKCQPAFGSLEQHFRRHYGSPASASGTRARDNFVSSLAAYSMATYILGIKDRHNGNILLDREGHLIHIDFGFVLGRAPGGRAALEHAAPFKLTREMVDVLGGPDGPLYRDTFVELCTAALREARSHSDTLLALAEMTGYRSGMSCFVGGVATPLEQLRDRLMLNVPDSQLRSRVESLIALSFNNVYTRAYDEFQKWSNGIAY